MTGWMDGYVKSNGIRIHYYRTGGDKPPLVLNHGAMDDGLCWTRVARVLEQDYDVIMLDARGHGLSDSGQGDYRPETRARFMSRSPLRALAPSMVLVTWPWYRSGAKAK